MKTQNDFSRNLDELLFENRNKAYGAYELRKKYNSRLVRSLASSISFAIALFIVPVLLSKMHHPKPINLDKIFVYDMQPKFEIEKEKVIVEKEHHQKAISKSDLAFKISNDSLKQEKKDTAQTANTANDNSGDTLLAINSDTHSSGIDTSISTTTTASITFNLATVDKSPVFPGGEEAMLNFLSKNIHYSASARENGASGKVYISFIVNSKGEIESVKLLRGIGYGLDEEVMRVVALMPAWQPGYYKGVAVSTIFNLPVSFNLLTN